MDNKTVQLLIQQNQQQKTDLVFIKNFALNICKTLGVVNENLEVIKPNKLKLVKNISVTIMSEERMNAVLGENELKTIMAIIQRYKDL